MMDKKIITIIILSLILIGIVGNFELNKIKTKSFRQGFSYASYSINVLMKNNLQRDGFIIFNFPINETTSQPIKLVPLKNE